MEETLRFLPRQGGGLSRRPEVLDDSLSEGQVREAMEALWPLPQRNPSVLLHGDFWPGNVLWQDDVLAAIIDWEHARLGDPLYDLAESRLEILWAFGLNAMHRFTQSYLASMPSVDCTHLHIGNSVPRSARPATSRSGAWTRPRNTICACGTGGS